ISLLASKGNWLGPGGAATATAVYSLLGMSSLVVAYALGITGVRVLSGKPAGPRAIRALGAVLSIGSACVLLHVAFHRLRIAHCTRGGILGEVLDQLTNAIFFRAGTALISSALLAVGVVLATSLSFRKTGKWAKPAGGAVLRGSKAALLTAFQVARVMMPTR